MSPLVVYLTHDDAGHDCYVWPLPNGHLWAMQTQNRIDAFQKLASDFNRFFTHPEEDTADAAVIQSVYSISCPWELRHTDHSVWDFSNMSFALLSLGEPMASGTDLVADWLKDA